MSNFVIKCPFLVSTWRIRVQSNWNISVITTVTRQVSYRSSLVFMEQGTMPYVTYMTGVVIDNVFLYRSQYRENKVGLEMLLTFS